MRRIYQALTRDYQVILSIVLAAALTALACAPAFSAAALAADTDDQAQPHTALGVPVMIQFVDGSGSAVSYRRLDAPFTQKDGMLIVDIASVCDVSLAKATSARVYSNFAALDNQQVDITDECTVDTGARSASIPDAYLDELERLCIVISLPRGDTAQEQLVDSLIDRSPAATRKALGSKRGAGGAADALVAGRKYDVHTAWISDCWDAVPNDIWDAFGMKGTSHYNKYGFAVTFGYSVKYASDGYHEESTTKKNHILWTKGANYNEDVDALLKNGLEQAAIRTPGGAYTSYGVTFNVVKDRPVLWGDCCSAAEANGIGAPMLDVADTDGNGRSYIQYLGVVKGTGYDSSWDFAGRGSYSETIDADWKEFAPTKGKLAFFYRLEAKSCITGENYQDIGGFFFLDGAGSLDIVKKSAIPSLVASNPAYSLEDAKFDVFSDSECTDKVTTLTCDSKGKATAEGLDAKTYWVKERKASHGYALDTAAHKVTIKAGQATELVINEVPNYMPAARLSLYKKDARTGQHSPEGSAQFSGALFELAMFPTETGNTAGKPLKTWTLQTDANGHLVFDREHLVSGDAPLVDAQGNLALPLGTYRIVEKNAPKGYLLNDSPLQFTVKDASDTDTSPVIAALDKDLDLTETPIAGGFMIGKGDTAGYEHKDGNAYSYAQGDATFAGAEFTVYNESANPVAVDIDGDGQFGSAEIFAKGAAVTVLKTELDEGLNAFVAKSAVKVLPYGDYRIVETKAPRGYLNKGALEKSIQIRNDGEYIQLVYANGMLNDVITGGVRLEKRDLELDRGEAIGGHGHASLGDANYRGTSLAGIEFELVNRSEHGVMVNGEYFAPGDVVTTLSTAYDEERKIYGAGTDAHLLPFGTYSLQEVKSNPSYLVSETAARLFSITEDGEIVESDKQGNELVFRNQVVRNDLKLEKRAAGTMSKLVGIPFLITNVTTREAHVAVTDANGRLDTASAHASRDKDVNANDALATAESIKTSDVNLDASVWFGAGEDGSAAEPDNVLGALPYGHYTIEELRCEANEGFQLWNEAFDVHRDSLTTEFRVDLGTVIDLENERIATTAHDATDADHRVTADELARIIDTVAYQNLQTGREYQMEGTLMQKETGKPLTGEDGQPITAQATFTPSAANGNVDIEFSFDASKLAGKTIVVFETLKLDGEAVATHEDINDVNQSITVEPRLQTSATDKEDGDSYVYGSKARIVDTVTYEGLTPGASYTMTATLMNSMTGQPVRDAGGAIVRADKKFEPSEANGSVKVKLGFDATSVAGADVVVFERCTDDAGNLIASHEDLEDEGQTVKTVKVATTVKDMADSDQVFDENAKKVVIEDTVAYTNLTPDEKYTITGTLVDKKSGEQIEQEGKPVEGKVTFKAKQANGTTKVKFELEPAKFQSGSFVAFETLSNRGKVVAKHADINSKAQTMTSKTQASMTNTPTSGKETTAAVKTSDGSREILAVLGVVALSCSVAALGTHLVRRRSAIGGQHSIR